MAESVRITTRVSEAINKELDGWSDRLGVSKSQLSGMAIQAGLKHIIRAVSPEDSIEPELLAKIMKMYEIQDMMTKNQ